MLRSIPVPDAPFTMTIKKWWWPPARKEVKAMAAIVGFVYTQNKDEIEKKVRDKLLYGIGAEITPPNPFGISPVRLANSMQKEFSGVEVTVPTRFDTYCTGLIQNMYTDLSGVVHPTPFKMPQNGLYHFDGQVFYLKKRKE